MTTQTSITNRQLQLQKIEAFRMLQVPGRPLVLYNIWDAGSAQAVAKAGAKALATSSWAVAKAQGHSDGEQIPYELAIHNLSRIVANVELPVSFDLESGYGEPPEQIGKNILIAIRAGAVGCNFEDSIPATGRVRDIAVQVDRLKGARQDARAADIPFFINARCDLFFQGDSVPHDSALLAKVVERAHAYAEAGADSLFVPGLSTITLITDLVKKSPVPINILADSKSSIKALADCGVSRVSYGATPYVEMLTALERAATFIHSQLR
ncbi:MAG: isocitrate lyase/phosphoenolpyruvate mutase family protein [Acidobacteriaceae bacterium]|nr:isocitrate lyase/phosphoenolpyruvate mutase family protein [Acidobacteriaceae bacterium]